MSQVRVHNFAISLDGFGTGEGLTLDAPFGHAGHRLHEWFFPTRFVRSMLFGAVGGGVGIDNAFAERGEPGIGAEIMGRGKFGQQTGPWGDTAWRGWWGDAPPFRTPVFVLTHHARPPIAFDNGTSFHFIDASPAAALARAQAAAGGLDVRLGGGPTAIRQFLHVDLVDFMHFIIQPLILGRGVSLWAGLDDVQRRFDIHSLTTADGRIHQFWNRATA